jgi:predicted amidohydrolase YtcJ
MGAMRTFTFLIALPLAGAIAVGQPQSSPNLVLLNGRVFTGNSSSPWGEALAIAGDRITAVGTTADVRALANPETRVIDLAGRLVVPGFNDAHVHPGAPPDGEDLGGPPATEHDPTLAEILDRLKAAIARAPKDRWIFGEIGGAVLDDPKATRFALDAIAPDHRVRLVAWTGHGTLFNTAALRHLGVQEDAPDPPGGSYRRLPGTRTISGVAHEYAEYRLHQRLLEDVPADQQSAALCRFAGEAASLGITSAQAMLTAFTPGEALQLLAPPELPVRLRLIDFPLVAMGEWRASARPAPSPRLVVSGIKWILDGTPVERRMWLREPYADRPTRGEPNYSTGELRQFLVRARAAGEQPMVHAVGDAAIDAMLEGLEQSGGEAWQPLRPRIEHGDLLRSDQFARARRLGVVLVQNPSHFMIPDVMRARLGDSRAAHVSAVKSSLAAGVPLAIGSDGPLNPFLNLMFAVTNANNPAEALTLEQAVSAYTRGSAFAEFQEGEKGSLAIGMLADLAVLSQDIFKVPVQALPATTSVLTIVGGRVVHETK